MKPFILEKHAAEYPVIRELQQEELELPTGGIPCCRLPTVTFTPDCDSGPEECDD